MQIKRAILSAGLFSSLCLFQYAEAQQTHYPQIQHTQTQHTQTQTPDGPTLSKEWQQMVQKVRAKIDAVPQGKDVIYLSGPVTTGGKGSMKQNIMFGLQATRRLEAAGFHVLSPFAIEKDRLREKTIFDHASRSTILHFWHEVLKHPRVKKMIILPDAERSLGAVQEIGWFVAKGKPVLRYHEKRFRPRGFALKPYQYDPLSSTLEHTILSPDADAKTIKKEAVWARNHKARAFVVRPDHVEDGAKALRGSLLNRTLRSLFKKGEAPVPVITSVIGFPTEKFDHLKLDEAPSAQGKNTHGWARVPTAVKLHDAETAIKAAKAAGAKTIELDMIIDVHNLKRGSLAGQTGDLHHEQELYGRVKQDMDAVILHAKDYGKRMGLTTKVKVIVETSMLTPKELQTAARLVRDTDALSIKTNTGYGPRGASVEDINILRHIIGGTKLIKASGGVGPKNYSALKAAGAHIFGLSKTRQLLQATNPSQRKAFFQPFSQSVRRAVKHLNKRIFLKNSVPKAERHPNQLAY